MPATKYHSIVIVGPGHDYNNIASLKASLGNNALVLGDGKQDISLKAVTDALKHSSPETHIHFWLHGNVEGRHYVLLTRNTDTSTSSLLSYIKGTKGILHLWSCYAGAAEKDFLELKGGVRLILHGGEYATIEDITKEGIIRHHEFSRAILKKYGRLPNAYDAFELSFLISPETVIFPHHIHGKVKHIKINGSQNYMDEAELKQDLQGKLANVRQRRMQILGHNPENFVDMSPYITPKDCTRYLEQALVMGISLGNIPQVQQYLDHGVNPNCQLHDGETPLYVACARGDNEVARILLESGADVNQARKEGSTPLYIACVNGYDEVARTLLESGADVNQVIKNGGTSLYIACQNGHDAVVKTLLANGADVNQITGKGFPPLYIVCEDGNVKLARILLENGADPGLPTTNGVTPLMVAIHNKKEEIIELLLPTMTLESIQKVHPQLGDALQFAKDAGYHSIAKKIEHWIQKKQLEKQPSLPGTPIYTAPVPLVDAKAFGQDDPQNMLGCGTELENVQEVAVDDIPDVTSGASRNTGILGDMAVLLKGVARLVSHGEKSAEPQATALPAPVAIMAAPAATPVGDGAWVVTTNTPESPCAHPGGGTNIIGSTGQQPEGALLPQCQGPKAETPGPGIGPSFTGGFVVGAITSATGKTVEAATQTLGADQDEAENYGFAAQGAVLAGLSSAAAVPGSVSGLVSWGAGYVAPSAVTAAVSYAADQIGIATGISQAVQGYVPKGWEGTAGNTAKNMAVIAASSTVLSWFDPTASASSLISAALGSVAAQAAISAAADLITGKTSFADRVLAEREKSQQEQPQLRAA